MLADKSGPDVERFCGVLLDSASTGHLQIRTVHLTVLRLQIKFLATFRAAAAVSQRTEARHKPG